MCRWRIIDRFAHGARVGVTHAAVAFILLVLVFGPRSWTLGVGRWCRR